MARRLSAQERGRIHALASIGWADAEIMADLEVSRGTVQRWKHRDFVGDAPRSGRPTKLTASVRKTINKQTTRKRRVSQRLIAQRVGLGHGTVQKATKQTDLSYRLRSLRPPSPTRTDAGVSSTRRRRKREIGDMSSSWMKPSSVMARPPIRSTAASTSTPEIGSTAYRWSLTARASTHAQASSKEAVHRWRCSPGR